jgi:hypothetical protein
MASGGGAPVVLATQIGVAVAVLCYGQRLSVEGKVKLVLLSNVQPQHGM